ncbi:MAG TPA: ABC transporter permease [Thermoanaerobaculia bacterium]|nr:ABC transporter permease [Thermoanaerobaculia bacterium]
MASWRRAFRLHLRKGTVEQDVNDEIAFHLEQAVRELMADGLDPQAAREEAGRRFGDAEAVRRTCREIGRQRQRGRRRTEVFSELWQDAVFALRQLKKTPGFTLVAVLTLALGIGATTAIFSLLHAVVLRPLPFPHAERIVHLWMIEQDEHRSLSAGRFLTYRAEERSFERLAATQNVSFNLTGDGEPQRIAGSRVSAGYFEVYGARPLLGRAIAAADDSPGRDRVAVLSYRVWHDRCGADPRVIGRDIRLNGQPRTVIGVMPESFAKDSRVWVPLALTPEQAGNYGNSFLRVMGRLRPGVSLAAAQTEAAALAKRLETVDPPSNVGKGSLVQGYVDNLLGGYRKRLLILLGAVGFVLLIACVNVANLLLARGAARSQEIAIRAALGAGQWRIVRQLLTESLVLSLAGAAIGIGLAWLGVRGMVAIGPAGVPRLGEARIDGLALAVALALGLAASFFSGLVPALRTARPDLQTLLKEGGRSFGTGAPHDRVRTGLLVAEVALALVLLAGAGLLIRSALRLQEVELGFDPSRVLTARLSLPRSDYPEAGRAIAAIQQVVDEAGHSGGVESAAAIAILPLSHSDNSSTLHIEGHPRPPGQRIDASVREVSPGYFRTLRIRLLAGRDFTAADRAGAPHVVAVSETMARLAWPGEEPIGKRLAWSIDDKTGPDWWQVVAVVGDVRQRDLVADLRPMVYLPMAQSGFWGERDVEMTLAVRTTGDPSTLAGPVRRIVHGVDARLPVFDLVTLDEIRADSTETTRFNMLLLTTLGVIGLLLAAVGIYGVISWFVSQRTQEIGLRMALGATEGRVLSLVAWQAMRPVLVGLAVGLAGAAASTHALAGLLFGVTATDPATFAGVVLVLGGAALLASYLPARRAARVEPTRALAP